MKQLWLGLLCLVWLWCPAEAQQWLPGGIGYPVVCAFNTSPPTISTGKFIYAQCDTNGKLITSGGGGGGGAITAPLGTQTPAASVATTINPAIGATGQTSVNVGVASTPLLAANACTHLMAIIVNPSETSAVWVNEAGGSATTAAPSIQLLPGMSITHTSFIPSGAVNAIVASGTANPIVECE